MFRFKKFFVSQEHAGMKVCTDSCLFGSLISTENKTNALDIGAGTGLLGLMLAQKNQNLKVTAIEIDGLAVLDATKNIEESPYNDQIQLIHQSIQGFVKSSTQKFDLIVSNPPFYQNNLRSNRLEKNMACHAESLTFDELANVIENLLSESGSAWIMLPPYEMQDFLKKSIEKKFYINRKYLVKPNEVKPVFREIVELTWSKVQETKVAEINIYENQHYSPIFAELLKDYYLIF